MSQNFATFSNCLCSFGIFRDIKYLRLLKFVYVRERPKFMGYPGQNYRQGGVDFFSAKKKGATSFIQQKKGGAEFFSAKKRGRRVFFNEKKGARSFFQENKGGRGIFLTYQKRGANTFFKRK